MPVESPQTDVVDTTDQVQSKDGQMTFNDGLVAAPDTGGVSLNATGDIDTTTDVNCVNLVATGVVSCDDLIAGDLLFTDLECLRCSTKFKLNDVLILQVIGVNELQIRTVPIHLQCSK